MGIYYAHTLMHIVIIVPTLQAAARNRAPLSRRTAKLSLSADVLDAARKLEINVSQVCDSHLRKFVRREQERRWREEHADFIAAYNATIEAEGLPLDEWRTF